ncbi:A/G-specific adenine glycosylase [Sulfurimonas sp.]|mgnify:CR=1 FL=1|jgi:A/G-specific adenine glycosylase|uniref:A/G-specific adenine glycosylase n=1 Tax=Sulfurimonas sp. TaxID=2022749 RepID=UPI0025F3F768|nr:A/G-specific adenine glycosylase [Sulfurimonas sp.]MBT5935190.1 A/G-specific adenine glycosylase [Sulfurimonas sp.]
MNNFKLSQNKLQEWYVNHGRHDLPWRNTDNMYHIYLSEIMLQQTQVSRVLEEYYPQFLEKYPTLMSLASAPQEDVLSAWSGLGYYSRARNLHKTAIACPESLPKTQEELMKLPGIGRYTASAICSFGHEQNIPVVDTNIARVIKRFFSLLEPKEVTLWSHAKEFVNNNESRHHNLALMDLGSLVCLPKNPLCQECPLEKKCLGKSSPELYTQTKKKEYEFLELFYGVYIKNGKIALQVSTKKMYKDMYVLPSVEPIEEDLIGSFKHAYTKYRLKVNLYRVEEVNEEVIWIDVEKLALSPISSLTKKAEKFFKDL